MPATATTPAASKGATLTVIDGRVSCQVCGYKSHSILAHVTEMHDLTPEAYLEAHSGAETISEAVLTAMAGVEMRRRVVPAATALTAKIYGINIPIDAAVPASLCGKMSEAYLIATKGKAKKWMSRAVKGFLRGRILFIHGQAGTGKDSLIQYLSGLLRKPIFEVTFVPEKNLAPMFYQRKIGAEGTGYEFGALWTAITKGVEARDGGRRPVIVLLSDVDRADPAQAEWFRILCDSMGGRISDPWGKMVDLFPGTQFICTANTVGTGDARGRMVSANPMDASLLDRLGRKIKADFLHWDDEVIVLRTKFPRVAETAGWIFDPTDPTDKTDHGPLGNASKALRASIEAEDLYAEFTHRGICEVLKEVDDIIFFAGKAPKNVLKQGFSAWLDGLDDDQRDVAKKLVDPHMTGGALFENDEDDDSDEDDY